LSRFAGVSKSELAKDEPGAAGEIVSDSEGPEEMPKDLL
jgi:hypothetical protein